MRVCILGGGTAGWMTASALAKKFEKLNLSVVLVESDSIGTVGVGEATLPHIRYFNDVLGIDEAEFMRDTQATFKLGIEFVDWGKPGQRYIHPFGDFGKKIEGVDFYQHWLRFHGENTLGNLGDYAFGIVSANNNKFQLPQQGQSSLQQSFGYAYQFDSGLYADFLKRFAMKRGVERKEGKVIETQINQASGNVETIQLDNGISVTADLFVDCSGFRGVLIEQALDSGYQDWSKWLPCNRALAVACESRDELTPYTRASAKKAGWIWRIPLQHRTGNGHVYWDEFISTDEAADALLKQLDGPALGDPRQLSFKTGRRNHFWKNNVVAVGLSAGFMEPLESTSIHLIQEGITEFIQLFPQNRQIKSSDVDEYNARMALQYERVRDFLLLHYVANEKTDGGMWRYFREMTLPDSLQEKLDGWLRRAYIQRYEYGAFLPPSWVAVLVGQNLVPQNVDPRVAKKAVEALRGEACAMRDDIAQAVSRAPNHKAFLQSYGAYNGAPALKANRV